MKLRTPLLLALAIIAGLFWSLGSDVHSVFMHFVAPPLFGVSVAAFWRAAAWRRQLLVVVGFLGVAETGRIAMYCLMANGWHHITADLETQLWLVVSFGLQLLVGLAVWAAARAFIRRQQTRTA